MYRILQVNTFPSGDILTFVQSCHETSWHFYKYVTNAFNVRASVSIDTKLYTCKMRSNDMEFFLACAFLCELVVHWYLVN